MALESKQMDGFSVCQRLWTRQGPQNVSQPLSSISQYKKAGPLSGNRASHLGNQVSLSGNRVPHLWNQVAISGDPWWPNLLISDVLGLEFKILKHSESYHMPWFWYQSLIFFRRNNFTVPLMNICNLSTASCCQVLLISQNEAWGFTWCSALKSLSSPKKNDPLYIVNFIKSSLVSK